MINGTIEQNGEKFCLHINTEYHPAVKDSMQEPGYDAYWFCLDCEEPIPIPDEATQRGI